MLKFCGLKIIPWLGLVSGVVRLAVDDSYHLVLARVICEYKLNAIRLLI